MELLFLLLMGKTELYLVIVCFIKPKVFGAKSLGRKKSEAIDYVAY